MLGNPGGESDAQSEAHFRCWKGAIYCNVFELMPSLHFITCRWKWMIRMTFATRHRGDVLESIDRTQSRPFEFTSWSGVAILLTSARLLPWYIIIHGTVQEHTWIWLCPHLLVYPVDTCVTVRRRSRVPEQQQLRCIQSPYVVKISLSRAARLFLWKTVLLARDP
jgi:hypothetical protein